MVVQGNFISYSVNCKLKKQRQEQLMESIRELDRKLSCELNEERLQMNYNLLSTQDTEKSLL